MWAALQKWRAGSCSDNTDSHTNRTKRPTRRGYQVFGHEEEEEDEAEEDEEDGAAATHKHTPKALAAADAATATNAEIMPITQKQQQHQQHKTTNHTPPHQHTRQKMSSSTAPEDRDLDLDEEDVEEDLEQTYAPTDPASEIKHHYRRDIDGLRAVAVVAIILYHWNGCIPGGFVGVDIFFVISGFLITSNIRRGLRAGTFSIISFYRKRVQRIMPALAGILVLCVLLLPHVLLDDAWTRFQESLLSALAFSANIYFYFYLPHGYFAPSTKETILLHLWSLGVEEQFYIVWPLLLRLLPFDPADLSLRRHEIPLLAASLLSIVSADFISLYTGGGDGMFGYYLLFCRFGELAFGGLVAMRLAQWKDALMHNVRSAAACAFAGSLLLLFSLFAYSDDTPFPGIHALPPVIGSCLLIVAGTREDLWTTRVLGSRVPVFIGLISYSAYLYHWPIFAVVRYLGSVELNGAAGIPYVCLSFTLAWLSFRFVETPTRAKKAWSDSMVFKYLLLLPVVGILALMGLQHAIYYTGDDHGIDAGLPSDGTLRWIDHGDLFDPLYDSNFCGHEPGDIHGYIPLTRKCIYGKPNATSARVFFWGDSMARSYSGMMQQFSLAGGFNTAIVNFPGCVPWFRIDAGRKLYYEPGSHPGNITPMCEKFQELMFHWSANFDVAVIAAAWKWYDIYRASPKYCAIVDFWREHLVPLFATRNQRLILMGEVPNFNGFSPACSSPHGRGSHWNHNCDAHYTEELMNAGMCNEKLRSLANDFAHVDYWEPNKVLCHGGVCSPWPNYNATDKSYATHLPVFYLDYHHLSTDGSRLLGHLVVDTFGVPEPFKKIAKTGVATELPPVEGAVRRSFKQIKEDNWSFRN